MILIWTSNAVILIVIRKTPSLDNVTGMLMTALAITDLVLGSHIFTAAVSVFTDSWVFGNLLCKIAYSMQFACLMSTLYIIMLLAIDKYVSIVHPLRYEQIQTKCRVTMCLSFVLSICLCLATTYSILDGKYFYYNPSVKLCAAHYPSLSVYLPYFISVISVCLMPTTIANMYCYWKILMAIRNQVNILSSRSSDPQVPSNMDNAKGIKMIVFILGVQIVCWLPSSILHCTALFDHTIFHSSWNFVVSYLLYCNSFMNWVVYTITYVPFRKGQALLFHKVKQNVCGRFK